MNSKTNLKKGSRQAWSPFNRIIKSVALSAVIFTGIQAPLQAQAQDPITKPSWWFGAAGGANFNFYRGSTQELNSELTVPTAFHKGFGAGLYLAPLVEFYRPGSRWGVMLQTGYDSRKGKFDQILTPCNCPTDLSTKLNYLTIEPSLRFAPFKSNFYLYGGPRVAINLAKSFTYKQKPNPDFPEQQANPDVKGDLNNINQTLLSMQIGAGYDIPLSSQNKRTQFVLSPFISFQPYYGESPRSIETWNITTLRVGAALKLGRGHTASDKTDEAGVLPEKAAAGEPKIDFTVNAPKNIPAERTVRETFPIRNYVFFNIGSTEIPNRYVLLKKDQVKDFKEDQVELFTPANLSGRSKRQLVVYYNILNILGDRMGKNPAASVKLVGSSEKGPADAREMAESIKTYLVTVFSIDASRIITEGRDKPKIPSEQPGGTDELALLREGDRRVSIESNSPALLMEFQSGPTAPLKPVEIVAVQEAPVDSYVSFNNPGGKEAFTSWSLEIKDEKGKVQNFGPFTEDKVTIPGKAILGTRSEGDYKVKMIGKTKNGKTVEKETDVHMVLWTASKNEEAMRFTVIYEINESKAITMYDKYLTEVVMPKIPKGGTVIIHGYTDVIGDANYNQNLSAARANDVKDILEKALANAGRSDVKFEAYGFGEDQKLAQFENKYPEERFYNRSVVIDIIARK